MTGRVTLLVAATVMAVLCLSVVILSAETTAAAQTTSLTSIADAQISENAPTTNYGRASTLIGDGDEPAGSGKDVYSLLKWDLTGI